jgi:hypothetical protein
MQKIFLLTNDRVILLQAVRLLDHKVIAHNTKDGWFGVSDADAQDALSILKGYGIEAEIRTVPDSGG